MNPGVATGPPPTVLPADAVRIANGDPPVPADGATVFARYAYPPNSLGYCGPTDHQAVLQYGAAGVVDPGLAQLARGFTGAWPYLELIAGSLGIAEPLDRRVVEAYWLGSSLLDRIDMRSFGASLTERFRRRAGGSWGFLAEAIPVGAVPNHSFHVFGVYPWVGMLGSDRDERPLEVLQRCRIRWGKVVAVDGDQVTVASRPLTFDGTLLSLGEYQTETVTAAFGGIGFIGDLHPGEWISMHWGWVCDRLSRRQLTNLRRFTLLQLDITNRRVAHPGPATVMG
ncbi:MAG: DUF6390 family protein [Candidatus Limnocylindria bacterium]